MEIKSRSQRYQEKRNSIASEVEMAKQEQEAISWKQELQKTRSRVRDDMPTRMSHARTVETAVPASEPMVTAVAEPEQSAPLSTETVEEVKAEEPIIPSLRTRATSVQDFFKIFEDDAATIDSLVKENEELMKQTEEKEKPTAEPQRTSHFQHVFSPTQVPEELQQQQPTASLEPVVEEPEEPVTPTESEPEPVVEPKPEAPITLPEEEPQLEEQERMPDPLTINPLEQALSADSNIEYTEPDFELDNYEDDNQVDFLDDALQEAKTYSMQNGERDAIDTTATILSELTKEKQTLPPIDDLLEEDEDEHRQPTGIDLASQIEALMSDGTLDGMDDAPEAQPVEPSEAEPLPIEEEAEPSKEEETIPSADALHAVEEDDLNSDFFAEREDEEVPEEEPAVEPQPEPDPEASAEYSLLDEEVTQDGEAIQQLTQKLERERIFREEMLQETKQMKLQMNQYESDLTTVGKNMNRTNRVLNFILILLIIALFCVLGFIAYWALVDRGVIAQTMHDDALLVLQVMSGRWML